MSIYQSVEEYAKQTNITKEQAKIRCDYYLALQKKADEKRVCPECKQATLVHESGCSEGGYGDYIYCENDKVPYVEDGEEGMTDCEFTTNDTGEYEEIMSYYDFDVVLAMAHDIERLKQDEMEVTVSLGQNWQMFVERENQRILTESAQPNISAT